VEASSHVFQVAEKCGMTHRWIFNARYKRIFGTEGAQKLFCSLHQKCAERIFDAMNRAGGTPQACVPFYTYFT
jgi:hypothetical protein